MKKIKLEILKLNDSKSQQGAYALVLGEYKGNRSLPIIIGAFEAQSIALELQKMKPIRPITHDLFKTFAESFEITLKEVVIYNLVDGVFFARIVCTNGLKEMDIDARTSDAVALAVRFNCPIYTFDAILSSAGIMYDQSNSIFLDNNNAVSQENTASTPPKKNKTLENFSQEELENIMQQAITNEDYEKAAYIRDEIQRRKSL